MLINNIINAILIGLISFLLFLIYYYKKLFNKQKKHYEDVINNVSFIFIIQINKETENKINELNNKYESEQKGRIRIEKEFRKNILKEEEKTGSFQLKQIGKVESCYIDCQGTPRQPGLVLLSRGKIIIDQTISPTAFEGLEQYSHIWVIFYFHLNSNTPTLVKSQEKGFTFPVYI